MTKDEAVKRLRQLETMCTYQDAYGDYVDTEPFDEAVNMAIASLERKDGEWIEDGYQGYPCVCSVCGIAQDIKAKFLFSFCPNCGARMVSI